MRTAVSLVMGLLLLVVLSCSSITPVPIRAGDVCETCRRTIDNVKIAAEIVPPPGHLPLKFRTVTCMARFIHEHGNSDGAVLVTDYDTGRLIQARSAIFVKSEIDENTKALDYFAFGNVKSAVAFGKKTGGPSADWPSILKRASAAAAAD
jgi:hypothetical protein